MDKNFRDMCAIMAMQGMASAAGQVWDKSALAAMAFDVAEAMLAEREKRDRDAKRDRFGRVVD